VKITRLTAALEADWISRQKGFETAPDGVVTAISRANRDRLLPGIESQDPRPSANGGGSR
jgi:hypothetical protein